MSTILRIVCSYCKSIMGEKDGEGISGDSHSICRRCWEERFPDWEYPSGDDAKSKEGE